MEKEEKLIVAQLPQDCICRLILICSAKTVLSKESEYMKLKIYQIYGASRTKLKGAVFIVLFHF